MTTNSNIYLKIKKEDIFLLCPFLESFEGLAAVRTPQPATGPESVLKLITAPDFREELKGLIAFLKTRLVLEELSETEAAQLMSRGIDD